jgi:hypothetical protein
VGPSLQIPKKTVDKLAGSLIFWGGSVSSKSQENCGEVQVLKNFGQAQPPKSQENMEKSKFQDFFGWACPLKIAGNAEKSKF